jgi:3'(2'), 5'-bisphosphate nucleotidase
VKATIRIIDYHIRLHSCLPSAGSDGITEPMESAVLLAHAAELARHAGAAILAVRARGFDVISKHDQTPVTAADHAAEALIVEALRRLTPSIPVVAEEEVAAGRIAPAAPAYWLVDPLDGTREFAAGRDEFTVNIGLVRDGKPVLGVVGVPAYGELFGGIVGEHAWKRTAAGERRIHTRAPPAEGLVVLASRSHANDKRLQAYLQGRHVASITNIGSGLKVCRLAEGVADLYPRFGRTMEWDTAAPQAVLEAAGGTVTLFDGTPLSYGKSGWVNPPFVCTGAVASVHQQ